MGYLSGFDVVIGLIAGSGTAVTIWYIYKKYANIPCVRKTNDQLYNGIIDNNTLIAKYHFPEAHINLRYQRTSHRYSLKDLVKHAIGRFKTKSGAKVTGIVIGDEECYEVFREIIDPVIRELHEVDDIKYQTACFKDWDWRKIKGGHLVDKKIISCVLYASRNVTGYPFPCALSNEERVVVAQKLVPVLNFLPVHLRGAYTRLCNLTRRRQQELGIREDYGLTTPLGPSPLSYVPETRSRSRFSHGRFTLYELYNSPDGRVIWWTEDRKCKVFINFLDHIKFVISNPRGDLQQAFGNYVELVSQVEQILKEKEGKTFDWHPKYGFLTSYLSDIGAGLHVEVKVRFNVVHKTEFFNRLLITKQILCNPCVNERNTDTFIISNKNIIGTSEVEIIQQVVDGITLLLEIDKRVSRDEEIKDLMP